MLSNDNEDSLLIEDELPQQKSQGSDTVQN